MRVFTFSREQLSFMLYALIVSKQSIAESEHTKIDELIEMLNK